MNYSIVSLKRVCIFEVSLRQTIKKTNEMNKLKQLSVLKNLLMDASLATRGMEYSNLTANIDMAMYGALDAYDKEEARLRLEGMDDNDFVLMLRD